MATGVEELLIIAHFACELDRRRNSQAVVSCVFVSVSAAVAVDEHETCVSIVGETFSYSASFRIWVARFWSNGIAIDRNIDTARYL
jgi:hypothetical protein